MYMWLLAILLIGLFAALGHALGIIRAVGAFLGTLLGLALAQPFGNLIAPLFPKLGTVHPLWLLILPVVTGFGLVLIASWIVGFVGHRPVELHYKYREDDTTRKGFEGLSKALGLFIGLVTGIILFTTVGKQIYAGGYLTTQTSADAEPGALNYFNQARRDMQPSGWDRFFGALDKTPEKFFQISDVLGLLYQNPLIHGRAASYPPFLSLFEKQEFKDIAGDNDLLKDLTSGGSFMAITGNSKVQGIVNSPELSGELLKTDLADFKTYLETGKSPKYEDDKILGHWRLDSQATLVGIQRSRQDITALELNMLRSVLTNELKETTLTAYVDGRWVVTSRAPAAPVKPAEGTAEAAAEAPPATAPSGPTGLSADVARRYGVRPGPTAANSRPAFVPVAPVNPFAKLDVSREGTWIRSANLYQLKAKTKLGKEENVDAQITDAGRLVVPIPQARFAMHFVRLI